MAANLIKFLSYILLTVTCVAQQTRTTPEIRINLADNVPADAVWIRSALYGEEGSRGTRGNTLKLEPAVRHFEIVTTLGGIPAQEARIVVYAPGCRFAVYDISIAGDVVEQFRCEPLPTKTVHGFIDPKEIPFNSFSEDRRLDIAGYFTADWVCDLFLQPRRGVNIGGGSCLGSGIELGTIGQLDPANGGKFDITIPDFKRDPALERFTKDLGVIELAIKEKKFGRLLATIKVADGQELGLNIQPEYRDPLIFMRIRP